MLKFFTITLSLLTVAACSTPRSHQVIPPTYSSSSEFRNDPLNFETADKNTDGLVGDEELEAMAISHFKNLDKDQNGTHEKMLLTDYLKKVDEAREKADENKDDKLSPAEFKQFVIE